MRRERKGVVLRIERASIHDGEGLRTVVFLKGCPLSCAWCSTPESQNYDIETTADVSYGRFMTTSEVMAEVEKDEIFYFHSNGGVTISGGEPFAQPDFMRSILEECKDSGINTAVESSLLVPFAEIEPALRFIDCVFADLKFMDGQRHLEYCGHSNDLILENLRRIDRSSWNGELIIRIPLIPGINDDDDQIECSARFCSTLNKLKAVELLPYHRLGVNTYEKLGRCYSLKDIPVPDDVFMSERKEFFERKSDGIVII